MGPTKVILGQRATLQAGLTGKNKNTNGVQLVPMSSPFSIPIGRNLQDTIKGVKVHCLPKVMILPTNTGGQ